MAPSSRRDVLKGIGAAGIAALATNTVSASEAEDRYILDTGDEVSEIDRIRVGQTDLELVHDVETAGFLVVSGDESEVESIGYDYDPDLALERAPNVEHLPEDALPDDPSALEAPDPDVTTYDPMEWKWDYTELELGEVHQQSTGAGTRIGIIDAGVDNDHPDLNVNETLSVNLTGDGRDPFNQENQYHGTHVAGIAAATGGSSGGSSVAPESMPFEDREVSSDAERSEKKDRSAAPGVGTDGVSISNSELSVDVGPLASGSSAGTGGDWMFNGVNTLYRETWGLRDGTNTHYDAETNGTIQSDYPSTASPGQTVEATVTMPVETSSGQITLEVDRRVTLLSGEATLRVEYEFTNPAGSGATVDDLRLSQYVDYDIEDITGDYGKYFFDSSSQCEYIFLEDVSSGNLAGFTAESLSTNHSLTQYSDGLSQFQSNNPSFDNDDREPDTGTADVELTFEWSVGTLAPGESTTFRNSFVYNTSESEFQQEICEESPGGGGEGPGVTGVAPDAELVSYRYFSPYGSYFGDFMSAVNAAILGDCDVINSSLGFINDLPRSRQWFLNYIRNYIEPLADAADSNGIVWTASAGNSGNNAAQEETVPGAAVADGVLSVSATGPQGFRWGDPGLDEPPTTPSYYTTYGQDYVDVSAPGGQYDLEAYFAGLVSLDDVVNDLVISTKPPEASLGRSSFLERGSSGEYMYLQGTSMSAPQVAGAAAVLKSANPNWSAQEIREVLRATARDEFSRVYHGDGFLDLKAALQVDDPAQVRDERHNPGGSRDDRSRSEAGDGTGGGSRSGGSRGSGDDDSGRGRGSGDDDGNDGSR